MGTADSRIQPLSVETTGGIGKHGLNVITALSKVAHPGDDEDPAVKKHRNVWKSQVITELAFHISRTRSSVMRTKRDLIHSAFFWRSCPGGGSARELHGAVGHRLAQDADDRANRYIGSAHRLPRGRRVSGGG